VAEYTNTLIHEVTVNRPRSSAVIAFEALASVVTNWSKLIHSVLSAPPILVNASVSSLIIELQTEAEPKLPNFFSSLRILIDSPTSEQISANLSHQECKRLELFLESLYKDKLTLSIKIISETEQPSLVMSHSLIRPLRLALIDFNQRRIESIEVPQADNLDKLFRMLELMRDGESSLGYHLSLSPRQIAYYKHAGRILDLLNESGSISSRGQYFINLSSVERYKFAMLLFESSPVGFAWLHYCNVTSVLNLDRDSAGTFLTSQCSDLATATIGRRAQTLRYWVTLFQAQQD
jgi:hypothetical protein